MEAFLEGFQFVVPPDILSSLTPNKLELMIGGTRVIYLRDWELNSAYEGYSTAYDQIKWFWEFVNSLDSLEQGLLLQFVTASKRLPAGGFSKLKGGNVNGQLAHRPFTIVKSFADVNLLPISHTCFNQLNLPLYPTKEVLFDKLYKAITMQSQGFELH